MNAAEIFNPKLVIGLIAAAIVAFIALLLLLAYGGGSSPAGRSDSAGPLSVAATGYKGLVTLVGAHREAHLDETSDEWSDHLLIVTIDPRNTAEEVRSLRQRRGNYPTVFILPKWMTTNDPDHRGWVRAVGPGVGTGAGSLFGREVEVGLVRAGQSPPMRGSEEFEGLTIPVPASPQVIEGPELTPLAALPDGRALIARIGDRPHYVVADPDLFNNHGLRDPARARAALAILDRMNGRAAAIDFDLTRAGTGGGSAPSMLRLAFEPPFLAMTLALFFAALAAGFYGAFRFGPVRREERAIALGKAALVENSAGLIRLARREARLGGAYADVVRGEAARLASAPHWLSGDKLDAYLDRIGRPGNPPFTALADALTRAADRTGLIAAARALHLWKKDLVK